MVGGPYGAGAREPVACPARPRVPRYCLVAAARKWARPTDSRSLRRPGNPSTRACYTRPLYMHITMAWSGRSASVGATACPIARDQVRRRERELARPCYPPRCSIATPFRKHCPVDLRCVLAPLAPLHARAALAAELTTRRQRCQGSDACPPARVTHVMHRSPFMLAGLSQGFFSHARLLRCTAALQLHQCCAGAHPHAAGRMGSRLCITQECAAQRCSAFQVRPSRPLTQPDAKGGGSHRCSWQRCGAGGGRAPPPCEETMIADAVWLAGLALP